MTNTVVLPKRKRRPVDKTLPVIMTLLLMMGLVTLFSATYYNAQDSGDALSEVKKQLQTGQRRSHCAVKIWRISISASNGPIRACSLSFLRPVMPYCWIRIIPERFR